MEARRALAKMVLPSHKRPVWRNGIIQIMVGRSCDRACIHCTQGSDLAGPSKFMTPDQFEQAVISLEGYQGVYGTFGGSPCLSPHFPAYCEILRARVPRVQCGLWANSLHGKGEHVRITYNPAHSNLNVHLDSAAADEFRRDWPECSAYLKGEDDDSLHGPPFVAMKDVIPDEGERWKLISNCDINKYWSAIIGVIDGEVRAFLCEIMFAQASLHQDNADWDGTGRPMPRLGLPATKGWWRLPMAAFADQVRLHCHSCGIPLRRTPQPAITGDHEEFSATHRHIARPKVKSRPVVMVESIGMIPRPDRPATEYLKGTTPGYRGD